MLDSGSGPPSEPSAFNKQAADIWIYMIEHEQTIKVYKKYMVHYIIGWVA